MPALPKAVLLHLDDTILDDSGPIASCSLEACRTCCAGTPGLEPESVHQAIERTREWYWSDPERHRVGRLDLAAAGRRVVQMALDDLGVRSPDLAERIVSGCRALRDAGLRPFEKAIDTVQWLRDRGCRLALLTNGAAEMQRGKIGRFALAPLFDAILTIGAMNGIRVTLTEGVMRLAP